MTQKRSALTFSGSWVRFIRPKDIFTVSNYSDIAFIELQDTKSCNMLQAKGITVRGRYLKLFELFLGDENVSHASIQELNNDRFAIADLHGKLANVCADLKAEKLTNTGIFKMLASGDSIRAQKKHGQPF